MQFLLIVVREHAEVPVNLFELFSLLLFAAETVKHIRRTRAHVHTIGRIQIFVHANIHAFTMHACTYIRFERMYGHVYACMYAICIHPSIHVQRESDDDAVCSWGTERTRKQTNDT